MVYRNHKAYISVILISVIFLMVKLFTAVVILEEGPTIFLVFRYVPSFETVLNMKSFHSIEGGSLSILLLGENGFIGEGIHNIVTRYLWWGLPVCTTLYHLINTAKNPIK